MTYVYDLLAVFNGLALLLVAVLLVRGQHRQFWAVLSYVVWELFATATLTIFNVVNSGPAQGVSRGAQADAVRWYARLYWSNDVIVDLFRFSLVIVLMYRATPEGAKRLSAGRVLGGVAAVAVVLPFLLFPMGPSSTPLGRGPDGSTAPVSF